jgi:hypothetical protein
MHAVSCGRPLKLLQQALQVQQVQVRTLVAAQQSIMHHTCT